jgi:hypothetical protein
MLRQTLVEVPESAIMIKEEMPIRIKIYQDIAKTLTMKNQKIIVKKNNGDQKIKKSL